MLAYSARNSVHNQFTPQTMVLVSSSKKFTPQSVCCFLPLQKTLITTRDIEVVRTHPINYYHNEIVKKITLQRLLGESMPDLSARRHSNLQ